MNTPRVSEELVGIYADLSLEDKAALDLPVVVELLAKDLQDARGELKLFCELAENESLTIQDYAREIEKKYGWDENNS